MAKTDRPARDGATWAVVEGADVAQPTRRPTPASPDVSRRLSAQRVRDTEAEMALRRLLHRRGLRYRVHRRPLPALRRVADLVFGASRVAVFVDGCFWHGCPEHATWPKTNAEFWRTKIERNFERDRETDRLLMDAGWTPCRVWEHEDSLAAADRVALIVRERRHGEPPAVVSRAEVHKSVESQAPRRMR
jgi:DNA mismatch endonuclease, patch repair protein